MPKKKKTLQELKERIVQKCETCEYYGPSFGVCFKKETMTNRRGICDSYQVLNDTELKALTKEEQEEFMEF